MDDMNLPVDRSSPESPDSPNPPASSGAVRPVESASDPRPRPPEQPLPSDCCDSGCDVCVHDTYAEELQDYRERLARWLARNPGHE